LSIISPAAPQLVATGVKLTFINPLIVPPFKCRQLAISTSPPLYNVSWRQYAF
jgi:hypothetical protein